MRPLAISVLSIAVSLLALPPLSSASAADPCAGAVNTLEINACMQKKFEQADARLNEYLAAARKRIESVPGASIDLQKSQEAWVRYRDAQCSDVYQFIGGTARTGLAAQCSINLTLERTHDLWRAFLSYFDSTPPVLPEPEPVHDRE